MALVGTILSRLRGRRLAALMAVPVSALLASAALAAGEARAQGAPASDRHQEAEADGGLEIQARELADGTSRLGVNLPPVFSYSRTPVFVDLLMRARRFGTPATPWDERALLGTDGWPVGDFGVMLMTAQRGASYVAGRYQIVFRGKARVALVASPGTLGKARHDPATGLTTQALDVPVGADQLALSFTGTGPGITDLKVIRPGYDASRPPVFTREFLAHLRPYKVLRLMDWLRTNNNPVSTWQQRSTPQSTHYASASGLPWEVIVELARATGKDLWINVPANADDDYVRALARLLHEHLPRTTRLYVEYSNEVWNGQFRQARDNAAAAAAAVAADPRSSLDYDGSGDRNKWAYRRIALRGKQISDLFRAEFGDAAMMTRIRPIYATQVVNTYLTEIGLDYLAAVHGPPRRYFYGLAGAPYFNLGARQQQDGLSTEQVLEAMSASIEALPIVNRLEQNLALANWHRLPFLAYEGGSDTFGDGSLATKKSASMDSRMEALCQRYLATWYAGGGGLFMWFTAGAGNWDTRYGTWELTTDLALSDTPKIRCLNSVLTGRPTSAAGRNTVPGRIDALAFVGSYPPYADANRDRLRHLRPGAHLDYLVLAPAAGTYQLSINAAADRPGNRSAVATAAGEIAGTVELPPTGWDKAADTGPLTIRLRQGFNTVRLTAGAGSTGFQLRHLELRQESAR